MARRKKSVQLKAGESDGQFARRPWFPFRPSSQPDSYFFSPPRSSLDYTWSEPLVSYQHEFLNSRGAQHQGAKTRMMNVMPWLLSLSLVGMGKSVTRTAPEVSSGDLQTPLLSTESDRDRPKFYEEDKGRPTSEITSYEDFEKRSQEYALRDNNLYGSTPSANGRGSLARSGGGNVNALNTNQYSINQLEFPDPNYGFVYGSAEDEYVGPAMELVYAWSTVDFAFDTIEQRDSAIFEGEYIAENHLPLGLEVWRDQVFVTLPKWKEGIPATLATVPRHAKTRSPKLKPYPNWDWNRSENCAGLTSVFRIQVDECDRLWVLDSGRVNVAQKSEQLCPVALFVFDLRTDTLIKKYVLPEEQVKQDSLYTNIVVDVRNNDCGSATAYLSDVFRFGMVVYDFYKDSSFRVEHHFFFPDPLASRYDLHGLKFQWTDGIFGIALSPIDIYNDRTLFFHPMSSFREFAVTTSIFTDKETVQTNAEKFTPIGRPRAKDYGHSSGSAIGRNGVMFFNMVTRDSVWCWDTRKEYIPQNLGVIGTSNVSLVFPNDIKVDHEPEQSVWLISNRLPMYLYGRFDSGDVNYRVYRANVKHAIENTVCDPDHVVPDSGSEYTETC